MQATLTNVMGSQNVIDSAIGHGVSNVVNLSTDKAVYPVNALGITKALMEKVVQTISRKLSDGQTILTLVRYGNILFSRGSVLPLFMKLIREKKPITVTEPEMTRFLLPLHPNSYRLCTLPFAMHSTSGACRLYSLLLSVRFCLSSR